MPFSLIPIVIIITTKCIQTDSLHRIVDGFTCHPKFYPYLVAVKTINSGLFCGGSLINKHWVVTAGHCCTPLRIEQFIVYTGLTRRSSLVRRSTVRRRIVHPDFSVMPLSSDLCLLQLNKPIRENPHIAYTKIANKTTFDALLKSRECNKSLTLGFGSQGKIFPNHTEVPKAQNANLQCVYQKVMPERFCFWNAMIDETMICTLSSYHESADVCKGDSGGPLICNGVQIGLVSAGKGCGVGTPSYFTRVDVFYNFIWKHANANLFRHNVYLFVFNFCVILFVYNMDIF